ncbi:hypothetical protein K493DRAFT_317459 [Basidiobolus meristosporus CBS 931.73]|uniref:Uncharacterized protein n=1 Tax=Basidiobolus meristosporus CBS 931.73 TaxID=1314790 RepID=A0A1Y1XZJ2_9FUNG|nr:hypothetical protein K493DRAFT_317459 [Basidiobolus meristosporus CBS 931.73]|eukprot:ORX91167.1 hypothetical protein K493DRAFT_317459 [Basidiobolus meristosporus CBS 931.73]
MSTFAMSRPLTPSSRHPDLKALSPKHHRQCWTLPPPDRSISANGLDSSLTLSPTNQRYERKAQTPGIRPSLSNRASSPHSPTKADLKLNPNSQNLYLDPNVRKGPSVLFSPGSLAQRLEAQPPLATRLMRDSERRELEKIDVFSPKPRDRRPLIEVTSTTPVRFNNGAALKPEEKSGVPSSPFVKCLLSNTPIKLPTKIAVESPAFGFNNPPKLRRLSITADSTQDAKQASEGKPSMNQDACEAPVEKSTRPLPNVHGKVEFEVASSPISPLRYHEIPEQGDNQHEEMSNLLSSSPVRDIEEEDPFMSCSKRRKISE